MAGGSQSTAASWTSTSTGHSGRSTGRSTSTVVGPRVRGGGGGGGDDGDGNGGGGGGGGDGDGNGGVGDLAQFVWPLTALQIGRTGEGDQRFRYLRGDLPMAALMAALRTAMTSGNLEVLDIDLTEINSIAQTLLP